MKKDAVSQTFDLLTSQVAALKESLKRGLNSAMGLIETAESLSAKGNQDLSACLKAVNLEVRKLQEVSERTQSVQETARFLSESVKERKDIFEAFMNNSPVAAYMLNSKAEIVYMNRLCQQFLGVNLSEARGKTARDILPAKCADQLMANDAKVMDEGMSHKFVEVVPSKEGVNSYWLSAKFPWRDFAGKRFLCGVSLDITETTRQEQALREKEECFRKQREDFMAALAHDLKTPVLGCDRVLELLITGSLGDIAPEHKEVLLKVQAGNKQLLSRIKDLLDVCRYEALSDLLHYQNIKLNVLVENVVSQLQLQADERKLAFASLVPPELEINADLEEIKRLLLNLLDNAVKFSPQRGTITIAAETRPGYVVVSVQDQGEGIAPADQKRLFDRFWQGGKNKNYSASIGLGLYLCQKIIAAHQGEIFCESQEGAGTKFIFWLPEKPPGQAAKGDPDLVAQDKA